MYADDHCSDYGECTEGGTGLDSHVRKTPSLPQPPPSLQRGREGGRGGEGRGGEGTGGGGGEGRGGVERGQEGEEGRGVGKLWGKAFIYH